ncbi:hypothetical protein F5B22DRAFT_646391 [Xylaria bambusicola]|uniref:uncharacterized protein n=1 Tax=Xylaria bambusicola TaxID=326684 RepID=UPI002008CB7D|nr:uncharacterized protein F5B22DRAFT_646391 [Xylaria bambusicola]KAI0517037.1 hypothetical protein F5B22DRAFT_646391 [Xylaria bambusicola]
MKSAVVIFALFTVAMGQFVKVPRANGKISSRQDGGVEVQGAAMTNANGDVIPFDSENVYKAASQ